jgi:iron complex outermembrane receptor protein
MSQHRAVARRFLLSTATAGFALAAAAPALASPADPPAAAQPAQGDIPNDIIVTAQRKSERLEEVPVSITAVTGQDLVKAGVSNFDNIGNVSPSTRIARTGIYAQPAIRGISSSTVSTGQENNVAVYIDGFYQVDPTALSSDFVNVQNVQVLKGPQGTLYGRNATGGALLVDTRDPSFDRIQVDGTATFGSRNDKRFRGYASTPIAPGMAFGISGYYRENDGYIRDVGGFNTAPFKNFDVRAKLKMEPTSNLSATLAFDHTYLSDARGISYNPNSDPWLGGLPVPPLGPLRTNQMDMTAVNTKPINIIIQDEASFKIKWKTGIGTLSSYTSWQSQRATNAIDFDGTGVAYITSTSNARRETFSQAMDFAFTPVSNLDIIVGGLYFDNKARNPNGVAIVLGSLSSLQNTILNTEAFAFYGDATLQVGEHLFLNGGLRYSQERKYVFAEYLIRSAAAGGPGVVGQATATFTDLSPRATIRYEIADRTNVYASYSQGFKSGTFNTVGATFLSLTTPVKPEKVYAYEVGVKTARGPFHADISGYYYDYKDLQVSSLQTVGAVPTTFLNNAATAEIYGIEASVTAKIGEALNVRAGGAWTHARYKSFPAASVQQLVANPPTNLPGGFHNVAGFSQDFSGRQIERAPDWTFNLGADYTLQIAGGKLVLAGNASYSSSYAPTNAVVNTTVGSPGFGQSRFIQPAYLLGSISADYSLPGDHFSIGVFAENVGDTRYRLLYTANGQATYAIFNEPRTLGVRVGYKY